MSDYFLKRIDNAHVTYHVIPHKSVLNSQNRRLWAVLHDLLSMYAPLSTRAEISRQGAQIRRKDSLSWIVRMTYQETPKIDFYISVTETFNDTFKLRFGNHEQWRHNTLESIDLIIPEVGKAMELRLLRDNMFSLACNYAEQTSPLRNVLDVVHQLREGDSVQLEIRMECVPRMKWRRLSAYSWKTWNRGKVPRRNQVKPEQLAQSIGTLLVKGTNEVISVAEDTLRGIEGSLFAKQQNKINVGRIEEVDRERQQLLVNGELSKETRNKVNLSVYQTSIYVTAHSVDSVRQDMLLHSIAGAFAEVAGDNRLVLQKVAKFDRDPMYLSSDEIGKLIQLPTADLQAEYKAELQTSSTAQVEIPSVFRDNAGIYMGDVTHKGLTSPVFLPTKDHDMLFTSRAFVAAPRAGKDMAIVNFVVEAKRNHGIGTVILDAVDERGERGMSDAVRDALNPADVIDLNLGDFDYPIYLGLQGIAASGNQRIVRNRIAQELTSFLLGDEPDGLRMQDYLFAVAQAANADPMLMRRVLMDADVRAQVIETCKNDDARATLEQYHAMTFNAQNQIAGPVLTRLGKILRDEFLKPLFAQPYNPRVDWRKWISENKVIIVRVPSRDLGPAAVKIIMHWLTLVVFLTKLSGCGGECFVVYNEPHQYETPGWLQFVERMLLEGPKYRIAPIFAFHTFAKLSRSLTQTLTASGVNWHIGNNSSIAVFEQLKDVLSPTFTPEEAKDQLTRYHFIAAWRDAVGEYQTPFLYKAPDLVHKRYQTQDNGRLTIEHSKRYGRIL